MEPDVERPEQPDFEAIEQWNIEQWWHLRVMQRIKKWFGPKPPRTLAEKHEEMRKIMEARARATRGEYSHKLSRLEQQRDADAHDIVDDIESLKSI